MADTNIQIKEDLGGKRNSALIFITRLFHFVCLNASIFVISFGFKALTSISEEQLKSPILWEMLYLMPCYLTNWNLTFQTIFLSLAVTDDVLTWLQHHESRIGRRISKAKDLLFSGVVFPLTLFVTGMFWSVYWFDRELVFPAVFDAVVPWWFNHCVHTNIVVIVAIETVLCPRRKPVDRKIETALILATVFLYAVVYYSIYFISNRWLYRVFGIMTWWQICLFQSMIWIVSYVFYRIQYPINRLFHGSSDEFDNQYSHGPFLKTGAISDSESNSDIDRPAENQINKENGKAGLNGKDAFDRSWSSKYRDNRENTESSNL